MSLFAFLGRSMALMATVSFMAAGFVVVYLVRHALG